MERNDIIKKMSKEGTSYYRLGKIFGLSRQRIHQICTGYRSPIKPGQLQGKDRPREKVRIRDNHTCQECGKKWVIGARRFDVHHINDTNGSKSLKYDHEDEFPFMITLCHRCHFQIESKNGKFKNKLTKLVIHT